MSIKSLTPDRCDDGLWSHPEFDALFNGREQISIDEFSLWMVKAGISDTKISYLSDEPDGHPSRIKIEIEGELDLSQWHPEKPDDRDWKLLAIGDTDDGAQAVWYLIAKAEGDSA